jgi:hypothetical protein
LIGLNHLRLRDLGEEDFSGFDWISEDLNLEVGAAQLFFDAYKSDLVEGCGLS